MSVGLAACRRGGPGPVSADAVGYGHDSGIAHRNLKPDDVIVDSSGKVKLIDFGLGTKDRPGKQLDSPGRVFQFSAPEFFLGVPYDGPKVDIWTLGILLFFMVMGTLPFTVPNLLRAFGSGGTREV